MDASETRNGFLSEPVRLILVSSDPHLRLVVAQELAADARTDLVGQAGSVAQARRRMAQTSFDVLLIDTRLDHALELIASICVPPRKSLVLVICAADDEDGAVQAFIAGASGCVLRSAGLGRFVQAALEVARGGAVLPPSLARRLLRRHDLPAPASSASAWGVASDKAIGRLSQRETEVLAMVARGLRTREIGQQLTISGDTVNAHIKSIYRKLQVHSRTQAARIAAQAGLL